MPGNGQVGEHTPPISHCTLMQAMPLPAPLKHTT